MPKRDLHKLEQLISARHPLISILTFEEEYALRVVSEVAMPRGNLWVWSCATGVVDGLIKSSAALPDTENAAAALFRIWSDPNMKGTFVFLDLAGHLKDEKTLRLLRELCNKVSADPQSSVILIDASENLPAVIAGIAAKLELSYPGEEELLEIVRATCRERMRSEKITIDLTHAHLDTLVKNLRGLTRQQARHAILDCLSADRTLNIADTQTILKYKRQVLSQTGLLQFVEAPTSMDEIGGLANLKKWLELRRNAVGDEATEAGIAPPRGVLLLGVQGAGKSLAAKAVATAWQRPLLRMDVGAFYNKFVGETERNLRDAFMQAEMMSPVVLWIDEIEKAFASASTDSADGGLSKRMFGALLTWMQEHTAPVFLIATANDIESLPPELMRKGRFDEIFFVDLPGEAARQMILEIHLKRRGREPIEFEMDKLVAASEGFSGAEIEQAIVSALYDSFGTGKLMTTETLVKAMQASPPLSVTMRERIQWLRDWAKERCVPAD
jgi:ATP-dependent 26S proteasome regulatory subunit